MGNRAVITTRKDFDNDGIGVYLHWNGGKDSVQAFLKYCEVKGYRAPSTDSYGWSYLCGVITNFFGDGLSCGIDTVRNLDCENWDNGTYIIKGWEIIDREYYCGEEQMEYGMYDMIKAIDEKMPEHMKLTDNEWIQVKQDCTRTKSFIDDNEKMADFFKLTKEEFLSSYSYLEEDAYNSTLEDVKYRIKKIIESENKESDLPF
ncbi:MAG: hypothetical protein J6B87_07725 [Clostridia bacterium]|nr:hypothetical protein [Clostridia bacterium]